MLAEDDDCDRASLELSSAISITVMGISRFIISSPLLSFDPARDDSYVRRSRLATPLD